MYSRYEEAADAWRHERQERRSIEANLERLHEMVEEKMVVVLEERREHAAMVAAYEAMEAKLREAGAERVEAQAHAAALKAEGRKREREAAVMMREIGDLQRQVAVALKEVQDLYQRAAGEAMEPSTPPLQWPQEGGGEAVADRSVRGGVAAGSGVWWRG